MPERYGRLVCVSRLPSASDSDRVPHLPSFLSLLVGQSFSVEFLSQIAAEHSPRLANSGKGFEPEGENRSEDLPPHLCTNFEGVPATYLVGKAGPDQEPDEDERRRFVRLFDALVRRAWPGGVVCVGDDRCGRDVLERARRLGIRTALILEDCSVRDPAALLSADAVAVPSRFAADYYRMALGRECAVLPGPVDAGRVRAKAADSLQRGHAPGRERHFSQPGSKTARNQSPLERVSQYLTFVDPSAGNGVYAFARIADELGRRRPDIPLLVVEGRGTEETVAACGLDLRRHGNVFFMAHTPDPKRFWRVARVCLMPSLGWETQGLVAVEALINGVPVVASDRGALPETLGASGVVLPLPDRITPATRTLPTAEEVAPWVEAVIRLWDDAGWYEEQRRRALEEARRWDSEALGARYGEFLRGLMGGDCGGDGASARERGTGTGPRAVEGKSGPPSGPEPVPVLRAKAGATISGRAGAVVLVPYLQAVEWECEQGLRRLEEAGVRVVRRGGCSAVDVARNVLASDALHDGFESLLFIDADIAFDPCDALRLLARPEGVVAGVYAKKGQRCLASHFAEGLDEVVCGAGAFGLYPLQYTAAGFLRVRSWVWRRMIERLELPLCNTQWGRGAWPFFLPMVVPRGGDRWHYLGEDWAFSHRLAQIGVTPLADTSVRLWHWGRAPFGWEDAGSASARYATYRYALQGREARSVGE